MGSRAELAFLQAVDHLANGAPKAIHVALRMQAEQVGFLDRSAISKCLDQGRKNATIFFVVNHLPTTVWADRSGRLDCVTIRRIGWLIEVSRDQALRRGEELDAVGLAALVDYVKVRAARLEGQWLVTEDGGLVSAAPFDPAFRLGCDRPGEEVDLVSVDATGGASVMRAKRVVFMAMRIQVRGCTRSSKQRPMRPLL